LALSNNLCSIEGVLFDKIVQKNAKEKAVAIRVMIIKCLPRMNVFDITMVRIDMDQNSTH
jgi:hypothetical protein